MKVAIVGSRSINDYDVLLEAIQHFSLEHRITTVISGGARGVDKLAERYAEEKGIPLKVYKAKWDNLNIADPRYIKTNARGEKYNSRAGYERNTQMAQQCDAVLALWDGKSRGTRHMIDVTFELEKVQFIYEVRYDLDPVKGDSRMSNIERYQVKVAPGNIWSGSKTLAWLTAPTQLAYKKGNLQQAYGIEYKGVDYVDVEHAYRSIKAAAGTEMPNESLAALMVVLLEEMFDTHRGIAECVHYNGGVEWLKQCSHFVGGRTRPANIWEGQGTASQYINCLIRAYKNIALRYGQGRETSRKSYPKQAAKPPAVTEEPASLDDKPVQSFNNYYLEMLWALNQMEVK